MIFQNASNCGAVLYSLKIPESDVFEAKRVWKISAELRTALCDPAIHKDEKQRVIDGVFPKSTAPFFKVMCEFGHIDKLDEIFEAYEELLRKGKNIVKATLCCAQMPDEDTLKNFREMLKAKYSAADAELEVITDSSLISGYRLTVGDIEYDKSVQGALKALQRRLVRR